MPSRISLSLEGLPTFETTPVFCRLPSDVEGELRACPDTFARAQVALRFLQQFGGDREFLHVTEEELPAVWAGFLRAALMEFAGMEESFVADLRRLQPRVRPLPIHATRNTMLIVVRELRNLHVHVVHHRFDQGTRPAVLRAFGQEHQTDLEVKTIPRSDLDLLLDRRVAKRYNRADLQAAVDWLDAAQQRWGIGDVVQECVKTYSRSLCAHLRHSAA